MDWILFVALASTAGITAFTSGLLGAGGSILFIPLVLYALPALIGKPIETHQATALSLVQGVSAVLGGGMRFYQSGQVDKRELLWAAPIMAAAGLGGGLLSAIISARALLLVFAVMTSCAAALLVLRPRPISSLGDNGRRAAGETAFACIGFLGGAVGVGAGFLSIPTLIYVLGVPIRVANGTGLALSLSLAAPGLAGKALTGQVPWIPAAAVAAGAIIGGMVGSRVNARVPTGVLRGALAILVALLSARVWLDVIG
jgi:uncharacterized membrane protein YfcA